MNVEIALLLDDKSDLNSHRASSHFILQSKRMKNRIHPRAAMGTAPRQTQFGNLKLLRHVQTFSLVTGAFCPRATAFDRAIKHAGQWLINNSQHAFPVFAQPNLAGEVAVATNKTGGAIEWIDHPDARLIEAMRSVNGFLCKNSVAGKFTQQTRHNYFVGEFIRLRYGLAVVGVRFLKNFQRAFVEVENGGAGFARKLERNKHLMVESFRVH